MVNLISVTVDIRLDKKVSLEKAAEIVQEMDYSFTLPIGEVNVVETEIVDYTTNDDDDGGTE